MRKPRMEPQAGDGRGSRLSLAVLALALLTPAAMAQAPNDPRYPEQWYLNNTGSLGGFPGADLGIGNVWSNYRGTEQNIILIIGDGIDVAHEDLRKKIDFLRCHDFTFVPPDDGAEVPVDEEEDDRNVPIVHPIGTIATRLAGIAAAEGSNLKGIIGVAPNARLVSHAITSEDGGGGGGGDGDEEVDPEDMLAQAFMRNRQSWDAILYTLPETSASEDAASPYKIGLGLARALREATTVGRHGLGNFVIMDAGDNVETTDAMTTYNGMLNSPYVNVIGGFDSSGAVANITRRWGPNILVSAPYKGTGLGITTTIPNNAYTNSYDSVAAAAAQVAGVTALMRHANPKLTWLDIRQILIATARQRPPGMTPDPAANYVNNGGGMEYSSVLGYGMVHAEAAVRTAAQYITAGPRDFVVVNDLSATGMFPVPLGTDPADPLSPAIEIQLDYALDNNGARRNNLFIEYVTVTVNLPESSSQTPNWGNLDMRVVSPTGVEFGITEMHDSGSGPLDNYVFGLQSFFGAPLINRAGGASNGVWTLRVSDYGAGGDASTLQVITMVKFDFYGRHDVDDDGLPDDWERRFFGRIDVINDRNGDHDGDTFTNWQEFLRGTDPAATALAIYNLTVSETVVDSRGERKLKKTGLLFTNIESGLSRAVLSWREGGTTRFAEEDWNSPAATFASYQVSAHKKVEDLVASFSPMGLPSDPFVNRLVTGTRITKGYDLGVTVKRELSLKFTGYMANSNPLGRAYGFGPINARLHAKRTRAANNNYLTMDQAVNAYKSEIGFPP